jgi:hypothetical protein
VTVYVPGHLGKGADTIQTGPQGNPAQGLVVPYQQVLASYNRSAHQALDRSALPPSLQRYVQRYFSSISH